MRKLSISVSISQDQLILIDERVKETDSGNRSVYISKLIEEDLKKSKAFSSDKKQSTKKKG
jgi:metal-responsive CopG/Arc/MetJ family transcriptional regulator